MIETPRLKVKTQKLKHSYRTREHLIDKLGSTFWCESQTRFMFVCFVRHNNKCFGSLAMALHLITLLCDSLVFCLRLIQSENRRLESDPFKLCECEVWCISQNGTCQNKTSGFKKCGNVIYLNHTLYERASEWARIQHLSFSENKIRNSREHGDGNQR